MTDSVSSQRPTGRLPFFIRQRLGLLSRYRFRYNDIVKLRPWESTYLLTDPVDIRHVLVSNAANYVKTPHLASEEGRRRAGSGLLTSAGAEHHKQRRLLQPGFQRQAIAGYTDLILDRAERMMAAWQPGTEIDVADEMADLAQSIIIGALFGDELRETEADLAKAIKMRRRYTEYYYHSRLPWREHLPTRAVRDHRLAMRTIDKVIYAAIRSRRTVVRQSSDMISAFMGATYSDGSRMSDRQVRDEVLTLTSAGYETIGDGLGWVWYMLAQHPEVEARLVQELRTVLGDRAPCAQDLPQLQYVEMVIAETLRLYPPTWVYVRVPLEKDTLPGGKVIAAGARLYLCQYVMHRHPHYFPEPDTFDPERFRNSSERRRFQYVYFPFGIGAHRCIGEQLAMLEGMLVIASVAQLFRFELVDGESVRPFAGITLRPRNGIHVRAHRQF